MSARDPQADMQTVSELAEAVARALEPVVLRWLAAARSQGQQETAAAVTAALADLTARLGIRAPGVEAEEDFAEVEVEPATALPSSAELPPSLPNLLAELDGMEGAPPLVAFGRKLVDLAGQLDSLVDRPDAKAWLRERLGDLEQWVFRPFPDALLPNELRLRSAVRAALGELVRAQQDAQAFLGTRFCFWPIRPVPMDPFRPDDRRLTCEGTDEVGRADWDLRVSEVVSQGYELGEQVLLPARVRVYRYFERAAQGFQVRNSAPASGYVGEPIIVVVEGERLPPDAEVALRDPDGVWLTLVRLERSGGRELRGEFSVSADALAGEYEVWVRSGQQAQRSPKTLVLYPMAPVVDADPPAEGAPGGTAALRGEGFGAEVAVSAFAGDGRTLSLPVQRVSARELQLAIPEDAPVGSIWHLLVANTARPFQRRRGEIIETDTRCRRECAAPGALVIVPAPSGPPLALEGANLTAEGEAGPVRPGAVLSGEVRLSRPEPQALFWLAQGGARWPAREARPAEGGAHWRLTFATAGVSPGPADLVAMVDRHLLRLPSVVTFTASPPAATPAYPAVAGDAGDPSLAIGAAPPAVTLLSPREGRAGQRWEGFLLGTGLASIAEAWLQPPWAPELRLPLTLGDVELPSPGAREERRAARIDLPADLLPPEAGSLVLTLHGRDVRGGAIETPVRFSIRREP